MTGRVKKRKDDSWIGCSAALCFSVLICTIDKRLAGIQIYASKIRPVNLAMGKAAERDRNCLYLFALPKTSSRRVPALSTEQCAGCAGRLLRHVTGGFMSTNLRTKGTDERRSYLCYVLGRERKLSTHPEQRRPVWGLDANSSGVPGSPGLRTM